MNSYDKWMKDEKREKKQEKRIEIRDGQKTQEGKKEK